MGWMDVLFGGVGSVAGSAVDFGFQALANSTLGMSKAQRQMNDFNSAEAEKARDFSALEAQKARAFSAQESEINRDWQEEMYSKYNSLQGKIQQAREAGVNPMFAVTGSATSPMSASPVQPSAPVAAAAAASGSSASPVGQISDIVGAALSFSKLQSEIKNINAVTRRENSLAYLNEIDSLTRGDINSSTLANIVKLGKKYDIEVEQINQDILNSIQSRIESVARVDLMSLQGDEIKAHTDVLVQQLSNMVLESYNIAADTEVKKITLSQIGSYIRNLNVNSEYQEHLISLVAQQTLTEVAKRSNLSWQNSEIMQRISNLSSENDLLELRKDVIQAERGEFTSGYHHVMREIKFFLDSILGWWSGSVTGVVDLSNTPKRKKVGYK